jgi:GntR family transcriptional regulator/GntR family frlABCD operon transcriptional regulator
MELPHYRRLYEDLKAKILSEALGEGEVLPSENALCEQYGVTRGTVRRGLQELEKEGLIYKHHGKGSIVKPLRRTLGLLSFRGFSDVLNQTGHQGSNHFLSLPYVSGWPESFYFPLSATEKKAGAIFIERIRKVDNLPVLLEHTYVPNTLSPSLPEVKWVEGSLFRTLRQVYGIEVQNVEQDVKAIAATPNTAALLGIEVRSPILQIYRRYVTGREGFFLYSSLYCNTHTYAISNTFH